MKRFTLLAIAVFAVLAGSNDDLYKRNLELARQAKPQERPVQEQEQYKDYYGTWRSSTGNQNITITSNKFSLKSNTSSSSWEMDINSWEAIDNPPGYKLIGRFTNGSGYSVDPPVRLYLDKGKRLRVSFGDKPIDPNYDFFYTKQ
jgi:hypothetical protein